MSMHTDIEAARDSLLEFKLEKRSAGARAATSNDALPATTLLAQHLDPPRALPTSLWS